MTVYKCPRCEEIVTSVVLRGEEVFYADKSFFSRSMWARASEELHEEFKRDVAARAKCLNCEKIEEDIMMPSPTPITFRCSDCASETLVRYFMRNSAKEVTWCKKCDLAALPDFSDSVANVREMIERLRQDSTDSRTKSFYELILSDSGEYLAEVLSVLRRKSRDDGEDPEKMAAWAGYWLSFESDISLNFSELDKAESIAIELAARGASIEIKTHETDIESRDLKNGNEGQGKNQDSYLSGCFAFLIISAIPVLFILNLIRVTRD